MSDLAISQELIFCDVPAAEIDWTMDRLEDWLRSQRALSYKPLELLASSSVGGSAFALITS
jgi:hypothetical protein